MLFGIGALKSKILHVATVVHGVSLHYRLSVLNMLKITIGDEFASIVSITSIEGEELVN